jgi:hypothetical protein
MGVPAVFPLYYQREAAFTFEDAVAGTVKGEVAATTPSPEPAGAPTRVEAMRAKIRAGGHASPYRLLPDLKYSFHSLGRAGVASA